MDVDSYRTEVNRFRDIMTRETSVGQPRTTYEEGYRWYNVLAEPEVYLYCRLNDLYLKAFRNRHGTFKFQGNPDLAIEEIGENSIDSERGRTTLEESKYEDTKYAKPKVLVTANIINATMLQFVGSYNSVGVFPGLGYPQTETVTVTLTELNTALTMMASTGFATKQLKAQRDAVARVVIGLIEAA